jgi:CheY-like chemotaxis protein
MRRISCSLRSLRIPASGNADERHWCHAPGVSGCLIVDDNASFLEAARILLEREGLSVAGVASTGADALRQVEALHPDVVLVDVFLGEESGLDLTKRLVQDGVVHEAPVILISTHSRADLEDLITASPAAGFLSKAELSASAIRAIVGDSSAAT